MFPTGTISLQQIRLSDDMSVTFDTIKCFLKKIGEKNSFKKKSQTTNMRV